MSSVRGWFVLSAVIFKYQERRKNLFLMQSKNIKHVFLMLSRVLGTKLGKQTSKVKDGYSTQKKGTTCADEQ